MAEHIDVRDESLEAQEVPVAVREEMGQKLGETALQIDSKTGLVLTPEEAAERSSNDHWLNTKGH